MDDLDLTKYEKLGPFEIKDFLQKVASKAALESSISYLNAGRGNPNWVATEPREAFFLFGQFAVIESKRVLDLPPGVGGMPKAPGIAGRLEAWLTLDRGPTAANQRHWLYQHAWIVTGARFGWWHGAEALNALIRVDRRVESQWGIGYRSEAVARGALAAVRRVQGHK